MSQCKLCKNEMTESSLASEEAITSGICEVCLSKLSGATGKKAVLDAIDAPVLLMQGAPRQVVTANAKAVQLFAKELAQIEAHKGGQVFDCVNSFTAAGCGMDINCANCEIKEAIVDTLTTAQAFNGVSATMQVKKAGCVENRTIKVSTEKVGDLALIRIEKYERS